MKILKKINNLLIRKSRFWAMIQAHKRVEFKKKVWEAVDGILAHSLACAYRGHKVEFSGTWGVTNPAEELYDFECKSCPMHFNLEEQELGEDERILIKKWLEKERKKEGNEGKEDKELMARRRKND